MFLQYEFRFEQKLLRRKNTPIKIVKTFHVTEEKYLEWGFKSHSKYLPKHLQNLSTVIHRKNCIISLSIPIRWNQEIENIKDIHIYVYVNIYYEGYLPTYKIKISAKFLRFSWRWILRSETSGRDASIPIRIYVLGENCCHYFRVKSYTSSTRKMEAAGPSETLVPFQQTTRHHIPEYRNLIWDNTSYYHGLNCREFSGQPVGLRTWFPKILLLHILYLLITSKHIFLFLESRELSAYLEIISS